MFDQLLRFHPFLGPSERLPQVAPKPTFNHPVARTTVKNENLNRPFQDTEPATPQPVANRSTHKPMAANVAPPGWEGTVKTMKREPGIDNPFALSWWMKDRGYKSHK